MNNLSSFENLKTSSYFPKTIETPDLSINTPYITKKFSSLISKQVTHKPNPRTTKESKPPTQKPQETGYKKFETGKSLEKSMVSQKQMLSATKNERNSSINENKIRQSTSRTKCLEISNYPSPQMKIPKAISKKSFHLNVRSLKHDPSPLEITQNMTPLNHSQLMNTSLNRSLNFSKNQGFGASPMKVNTNMKEHIRTKTQTSTNETNEIQTERQHFLEKKRKNLLKNNSSSNILEIRKKTSYCKKDQSVNVKKINLLAKTEDFDKNYEIHSLNNKENSFEKALSLNKQTSNLSDGPLFYKEESSYLPIGKRLYLRNYTKKQCFDRRKFKKEKNKLRKQLNSQKDKQKNLLKMSKKLEDNKEMLMRGIKNLMKENLSVKIALDFLQLSHNKMAINFDFLMKTPGMVVPTTDFRVFYDKILGSGGFGTVYEGVFINKKVAIKVMNIPLEYLKMLLKEIITMIICDHVNLVKLHAVSFGNAENNQITVFIIMDCLKQDLKNLVFREKPHLPLKLKYKILIDILKGLCYLHDSNYVHCDLKLQNVLIDEHFNAKISDFGLTNCLRFGNTKNTLIAGYSERTSAYEYLCEQKISTKGDIWSFGILMYELMNEKISWENLNGVQVVAKVSLKTNFFDYNLRSGNKIEENIVESCLNYNYTKRPTAKELLNRLEGVVMKMKS